MNYNNFPKSLCTSPNEVVCHGIPDQRVLLDGDIINLDISLYHEGFHADVNETYYVGDRAKTDPDSIRVVETARECLDKAIELVKPGTPIREFGKVIEKHAKSRNCSVFANWGGHGINTNFHPPPWIPHYGKNKAVGVCQPGMAFTIEPILGLGKPREVYWPDNWTNVAIDGKRTAQFGVSHEACCVYGSMLTYVSNRTHIACHRNRRRGLNGEDWAFSGRTDPGGPIPMPTVMNETEGFE